MKTILRPIAAAEMASASALIRASFLALVADECEPEAQVLFLSEPGVEMLERTIHVAAYQLGAFIDAQLVGFLVLASPSVLCSCFVHPQFPRQGIGRRLWEGARSAQN